MNKKKWLETLQKLKLPHNVLILTGTIGVLIGVLLYSLVVHPMLDEHHQLSKDIEALEKQQQLMASQPKPEKVEASDFKSLFDQVPVNEQYSQFVEDLKRLEVKSEAVILNVAFDQEGQAVDISSLQGLVGQVNGLNNSELDEVNTTAQNENNTTPSKTSPNKDEEALITSLPVRVSLQGSYEQILTFIEDLQTLDRLIRITSWTWHNTPQSGLAADVNLELFKSEKFANIYASIKQQEPELLEPTKARNPILSDEQFLEQLSE